MGRRIFTHFPPADTYNGDFSAARGGAERRRFQRRTKVRSRSLYLFGWGDGGGGPEPDMIESARRLQEPRRARHASSSRRSIDFFTKASAEAHDLTTWVGELYFELHRGTYTTQSRTKRSTAAQSRLCARPRHGRSPRLTVIPKGSWRSAWKRLLINQFHDILPGSSIDWVYEDAERDLEEVIETAGGLTAAAQIEDRRRGRRTSPCST